MFAPVEVVIREVIRREESLQGVIVDFAHVQAVDFVTCRLLAGLIKGLIRSRKFVSISRAKHLPVLTRVFRRRRVRATFFDDLDLALEDGENRILSRFAKGRRRSRRARLADCISSSPERPVCRCPTMGCRASALPPFPRE